VKIQNFENPSASLIWQGKAFQNQLSDKIIK
jgi:hypothetical protein